MWRGWIVRVEGEREGQVRVTTQVEEESWYVAEEMAVLDQMLSSIMLAYDSNQSPSLSLGVNWGQFGGKGRYAMWVYSAGSWVTRVWFC